MIVPVSLQHLLPSPGHLALLSQSGQCFTSFAWQSSIALTDLADDWAEASEANAAPTGAVATASPMSAARRMRQRAIRLKPQAALSCIVDRHVNTLATQMANICGAVSKA
ncbi:MAG: hypothetical protein AB7O44_32555 [Hyphomicrobiaceae bacterium]